MPPPKKPLSADEKALRSRIKFIEGIFNKIRMQYSMQKGKMTLKEVLVHLHSEGELEYAYEVEEDIEDCSDVHRPQFFIPRWRNNLNDLVTFPQLKSLEAHYIWNYTHNANYTYSFQKGQEHGYEGYTYPSDSSKFNIRGDGLLREQSSREESSSPNSTKEEDSKWKNFFTSPSQTASLRGKHQRDTAKEIYINFTSFNRRATLLEGGAGNGKTFVAAAVVRKLIDENFFKDCRSPWPVLWITRASIVEQTSRVCRELFGLCPHTECIVINVEQLRAKFGEYMVDCSTIVKGGEEHIIWQWREKFHPMMFIIDECQFAKNDDSTQAKIISAISEINPIEMVRLLFMSATPFTRVLEAKYFAVNCHMDISI